MNQWTPAEVITIITALGGVVVAIIGALRGTAAQTQSKSTDNRVNLLSDHVNNIALQTPTPTQNPTAQSPAAIAPLIPFAGVTTGLSDADIKKIAAQLQILSLQRTQATSQQK